MKTNCCPTCGRVYPKARCVQNGKDPSAMTDKELYAHYKASACLEDGRFFLSVSGVNGQCAVDLAVLLTNLERRPSTSNDRRELNRIKDTWRASQRPPADEEAFWAEVARDRMVASGEITQTTTADDRMLIARARLAIGYNLSTWGTRS